MPDWLCKEVNTIFTGIVEELGKVESISQGKLCIKAQKVLQGTQLGDSIAVNGICLTVTNITNDSFTADVMPETFRKTALGSLKYGSNVNLERALCLNSRLGGHIVSGHIDGTGTIKEFKNEGNAIIMSIKAPHALLKYVIPKGSIAIDGISLTVVSVTADEFSVSLIPHTRLVTCLKDKKMGDAVNLETDVIAKYIEKLINHETINEKSDGLSRELLLKYGF